MDDPLASPRLHGIEESLLSIHQDGMQRDFRRLALLDLVKRLLPHSGRCLDMGCGTGFMTAQLARLGLEMTGIDVSESLVAHARLHLAKQGIQAVVVRADVTEAPGFGPFDVVLCLDVIEHIEDDRAALSALYRACRPNGKLVISVPALPQLYGERDHSLGHFRRYDKKMLVDTLTGSGFDIERCCFWNLVGVLPYWFDERVLGRPIKDDLRTGADAPLKQAVRYALWRWLSLEGRCSFLPFVLSLVCLARAQ